MALGLVAAPSPDSPPSAWTLLQAGKVSSVTGEFGEREEYELTVCSLEFDSLLSSRYVPLIVDDRVCYALKYTNEEVVEILVQTYINDTERERASLRGLLLPALEEPRMGGLMLPILYSLTVPIRELSLAKRLNTWRA